MGQPYVSGPVPIFLGQNSVSSPVPKFLGYCERMPRRMIRPTYSPVFVDVGGQQIPFDLCKQGSDAIIVCDFTYFNFPIYQELRSVTASANTVPGDLGTLMATEQGVSLQAGFPLWMPFPYSAKPSMSTMDTGEHYFCCCCMNDDLDQLGTVAMKKRLVFHAIRKFDGSVNNANGWGGFTLFDTDVTALAGIQAA